MPPACLLLRTDFSFGQNEQWPKNDPKWTNVGEYLSCLKQPHWCQEQGQDYRNILPHIGFDSKLVFNEDPDFKRFKIITKV